MEKLILCKLFLTKKGLRIILEDMPIKSKSEKVIFVEHKKRKKLMKKSVGVIKTNLKNLVQSENAAISFHCISTEQDCSSKINEMRNMITDRVNELKRGVDGLLEGNKILYKDD